MSGPAPTRLDPGDPGAVAAFIRQNTKLLSPPLVPEIRLHLAEESLPIWQKTEEQLGEINIPPPFWAFAWAGGQALARYLIDNAALTHGKRVLDLGTGSGLTAIASRLAGAQSVLASDIDLLALAATQLNATQNQVTVETTAEDLIAPGAEARGSFDVVLVGDLFYERALAQNVLAFIDRASAGGALVLIGDPRRSYFPADRFSEAAHYQVPVTRELEDSELKRTTVWRL